MVKDTLKGSLHADCVLFNRASQNTHKIDKDPNDFFLVSFYEQHGDKQEWSGGISLNTLVYNEESEESENLTPNYRISEIKFFEDSGIFDLEYYRQVAGAGLEDVNGGLNGFEFFSGHVDGLLQHRSIIIPDGVQDKDSAIKTHSSHQFEQKVIYITSEKYKNDQI